MSTPRALSQRLFIFFLLVWVIVCERWDLNPRMPAQLDLKSNSFGRLDTLAKSCNFGFIIFFNFQLLGSNASIGCKGYKKVGYVKFLCSNPLPRIPDYFLYPIDLYLFTNSFLNNSLPCNGIL